MVTKHPACLTINIQVPQLFSRTLASFWYDNYQGAKICIANHMISNRASAIWSLKNLQVLIYSKLREKNIWVHHEHGIYTIIIVRIQ